MYRNKKGLPIANSKSISSFFNVKDRVNAVDYQNINNLHKIFNEKFESCLQTFILINIARNRAITKKEILDKLNMVLKYNVIQVKHFKFIVKN